MEPKEVCVESIVLDQSQIIAPYSFDYQLHHYVVYPEVREGDTLVEVFQLKSGRVVKVEIRSIGTTERPSLELTLQSIGALAPDEVAETRETISWYLGLKEDLRPFYRLTRDDRVMQASLSMHYGAKEKASFPPLKAILDCVCAQNIIFKRLYVMMRNLSESFGSSVEIAGRTYYAFPTAEQLADATLDALRACKLGYRDKYVKGIAEAIVLGVVKLGDIASLPNDLARKELSKLPGVGPYTADLGLVLGWRRRDILHLDLYVREALRVFYFGGREVSDRELREFADLQWPGYQAWAAGLLTTNTELWAAKIGVDFRLKSGARV